jgi:hypothetical protein
MVGWENQPYWSCQAIYFDKKMDGVSLFCSRFITALILQDCPDPPFWANWLRPLFAAKQLVPPLVPPAATLPDEQPWSLRKGRCWIKAFHAKAHWFGTPPALEELLQELAFSRCDVSIAGGITTIADMTSVTPSRKLIFFTPYLGGAENP